MFWSQVATIDYRLLKVVSNKEKVQLRSDDGGEGDLSSCTADDETCSYIGLGYNADVVEDGKDEDDDFNLKSKNDWNT